MKRHITYIFLTALIIVVSSCSLSRQSIYKSDYPLSSDQARSSSTDLIVNVPVGWMFVDENKTHSIDLWLISEDFSSTVTFTPIHIDEQTFAEIKESGMSDLQAALNYSKTFRKAHFGKEFKQLLDDEYFEINGRPFAAYQYTTEEGLPGRVVVFRFAQYYYEASAEIKVSGNPSQIKPEELFELQNSILSSLR